MYPFMTLDDEAEIVHFELLEDGQVKIYVEKPDEKDGFHYAACYLPSYTRKGVSGFIREEAERYVEVIRSTAHLFFRCGINGTHEQRMFRTMKESAG